MVTAEKSRRIAKFAFDYATKHGRKRVCSSKFERRSIDFAKKFYFVLIGLELKYRA